MSSGLKPRLCLLQILVQLMQTAKRNRGVNEDFKIWNFWMHSETKSLDPCIRNTIGQPLATLHEQYHLSSYKGGRMAQTDDDEIELPVASADVLPVGSQSFEVPLTKSKMSICGQKCGRYFCI